MPVPLWPVDRRKKKHGALPLFPSALLKTAFFCVFALNPAYPHYPHYPAYPSSSGFKFFG